MYLAAIKLVLYLKYHLHLIPILQNDKQRLSRCAFFEKNAYPSQNLTSGPKTVPDWKMAYLKNVLRVQF